MDLSEGLSTEVLHPILSNADFMRQLRDFLPPSEGNDTAQMVRDTVQSPQFAQVMAFISFAILNISIELGALMFKKRKKILIKIITKSWNFFLTDLYKKYLFTTYS